MTRPRVFRFMTEGKGNSLEFYKGPQMVTQGHKNAITGHKMPQNITKGH